MPELPAAVLVPEPRGGRVFRARRVVRWGDVDRRARLRLDALATYLQDVAGDDSADAGLGNGVTWVLRRNLFEVVRAPSYGEELDLSTWSAGTGRRWAERRLSIRGAGGGAVEGASLWVHLDSGTRRPAPLDPAFTAVYGAASAGREVSSRLQHPAAPPEGEPVATRSWPLREIDFDPLGHVNNAAAWALVEEVRAERPVPAPFRAEIEHREPVEATDPLEVVVADAPEGGVALWARGAGGGPLYVTARLVPLPG